MFTNDITRNANTLDLHLSGEWDTIRDEISKLVNMSQGLWKVPSLIINFREEDSSNVSEDCPVLLEQLFSFVQNDSIRELSIYFNNFYHDHLRLYGSSSKLEKLVNLKIKTARLAELKYFLRCINTSQLTSLSITSSEPLYYRDLVDNYTLTSRLLKSKNFHLMSD
ncbi:hypothetical protein KGF54_003983 [Candida jiufengensis]|uniref:uncharacterized protein n=1 Tax=Candida jiufengensis TaxID=497108 RepID=UPI00222547DE|nr:uncharacterized protein KGF54_003983 [Candida jiufengensis]KAI5950909.1 hypothetical protein KGF54_003983 [Candida jiufengensis]